MSAWWRATANYIRYSQVAAAAARRALKPELKAGVKAASERSTVVKVW